MKYFYVEGEMFDDFATSIFQILNDNEGDVTIGFCSMGGDNRITRYLLDALNQNKDRVTLVAVNSVYSSAFELFYRFKGKRVLGYMVRGMYHQSSAELRISVGGRPQDVEHQVVLEDHKADFVLQTEFVSKFMNDSELRKFKNNQDVYFGHARMMEIFKDNSKWLNQS